MKRLFLSLALSLCPLGIAWSQTASVAQAAPSSPVRGIIPASSKDAITPAEWHELKVARDAALKRNPDLVEAGKQLEQKLRDFQRKLDLAVLKIDPTVAPIVGRLESIPGSAQPPTTPPSGPVSPAPLPNAPPRAPAAHAE